MGVFLLIIALCVAQSLTEEVLRVSAGDSYLDAYKKSSSSLPDTEKQAEKKSDVVYPVYSGPSSQQYAPPTSQYGAPTPQYGPPDPQYGPPTSQYGAPTPQYGPPDPQYGPPTSQYGAPTPQYGPSSSPYGPSDPQYGPPSPPQYGLPSPQYGPPAPQYGPASPPPSYGSFGEPIPQYGPPPVYGPPAQNLQVFYGMPHAMIGIWDKLWEKIKWKLNLFTLGKIILKLVIFKKIVSLVAIICLLLFIPSLKHKKGLFHHDDEGERSLQTNTSLQGVDSLNVLSGFVIEAIENYTNSDKKVKASCDTPYCKVKKYVNKLDKKLSYDKLATLYTNESS